MDIKTDEHTETMMNYLIATGRCRSEFIAKLLFPVETERDIKLQRLSEERLEWLKKFAYYLEYSKTAPTKKQQADYLEKKYQLLLKFVSTLVHDAIAMQSHWKETEKELEAYVFQPYN